MAGNDWTWNGKSHRYHNKATGRFISERQAARLRDDFIDARAERLRGLTADVFNGDRSIASWERESRTVIKETWGASYALGRGGRNAMGPSDWGRVGARVAKQYEYLHGFAQELADGALTQGQAMTRSALYAGAATLGHEQGKVAAYGGELVLPAYPGDGSTECFVNCRCHWEIDETETSWRATWQAYDDGSTCEDCDRRAGDWSPYVVDKASRGRRSGPARRARTFTRMPAGRPGRRPTYMRPGARPVWRD